MSDDDKQGLVVKSSAIELAIPPEALKNITNFLDVVFGKSLKSIGRMLSSELEMVEWQRSLRLNDKVTKIIDSYEVKERLELPKPSFVKELIEKAILEDTDELQDIWARLLVSSMDANLKGSIRVAFIDILRQLEVIDIKILNYCFEKYIQRISESKPFYENPANQNISAPQAEEFSNSANWIIRELEISANEYKVSIDNLMRCRLIQGAYSESQATIQKNPGRIGLGYEDVIKIPQIHVYDKICLTELGINFIKCCTGCDDIFIAAGIQRPLPSGGL